MPTGIRDNMWGVGLRDRDFNRGLSPVSRDGICCHHLLCFSAYLPTYDTGLGAQERGHFNGSCVSAALKSPGRSWSFCGYVWSLA